MTTPYVNTDQLTGGARAVLQAAKIKWERQRFEALCLRIAVHQEDGDTKVGYGNAHRFMQELAPKRFDTTDDLRLAFARQQHEANLESGGVLTVNPEQSQAEGYEVRPMPEAEGYWRISRFSDEIANAQQAVHLTAVIQLDGRQVQTVSALRSSSGLVWGYVLTHIDDNPFVDGDGWSIVRQYD